MKVIGKPPELKPRGLRVRIPICALGTEPALPRAFEAHVRGFDTLVPKHLRSPTSAEATRSDRVQCPFESDRRYIAIVVEMEYTPA